MGDSQHLDLQQWAAELFKGNLPIQLTDCLGREHELHEIKGHFSSCRMLTLTGVGGVGKTRLALQLAYDFAHQDQTRFEDGLWFVTLAHLRDPITLLPALAQAFSLHVESEQALLLALCTLLRSKRALLILDNCEHLIETCATVVEALLQMCPNLCILATSRETLRVRGETVYALAPLEVPPPSAASKPASLADYSATALFLARARASHPAFRATARNASALVTICQQLDGLPLAIELAAPWIRAMSAEQIAEQVSKGAGERFSLLTNGNRTALPRQQTLRATLDWSYALLPPAHQRLLLRLAVFAGGWTLEEAQIVCADEWTDASSMLDRLAKLVNASLVLVDRHPGAHISSTGEIQLVEQARYRLLETVRQYALEKSLRDSDQQKLRDKHLDYFLLLAEKTEPELREASQLSWLAYLDMERDNFRVALEHARHSYSHETGLRLANALWWYWALRSHFSEGRTWLEESALLLEERASSALRAVALYRAGMLAFLQGDLERLEMLAEKSLALFRVLKDVQGIAAALSSLVHVSLRQRNHEQAQYLGEESLALARTVGDRWYIALTLLPLAVLRIRQKDPASASVLIEESLGLFRVLNDRWGIAYAFDTLGQLADSQHDIPSSIACFKQSLELFTQLNNPIGTACSLLHLGLSWLGQGEYARATSALEESLRLCRTSGRQIGVARALLGLGRIKLHLQDFQEAALLLEESLQIFREYGDVRGFAGALTSLREVALQRGHLPQIKLLGQHTPGKQYAIDDPLDMVASLETLASSEMAQIAFSGRMRPVGWLKRVIGILHETLYTPASEQTTPTGWVRNLVEEHIFLAAHPFVNETGTTLLPWDSPASAPFLSEESQASTVESQAQERLLPAFTNVLTNREQEVLQLVERGLKNAQIAQRLVISVGTVRTHLASIYTKLGVASRTAAVHTAHERHFL